MDPAVTIGVMAAGAMDAGQAAAYIVSRLLGAVLRAA
jgi:glycerol uptake facilitator-like aquaporin